jgi:antitoxin component YwqK of YwqJK toxin-antitoxin module
MRVDEDDTDMDESGRVFYRDEAFTGVVVEKARDGSVVSTYSYFAGFPDGPFQEWRGADQLRKEGTMRDGRPVGVLREWHSNGRLAVEAEFDEHGSLIRKNSWAEDGSPA